MLSQLPWKRIALASLLLVAVVVAVPRLRSGAASLVSRAVLFVATPFAPDISGFDDLPESSRVVAADGSPLATLTGVEYEPVRLEALPAHVTRAVLAAEDGDFYHHSGVDPAAVFRALLHDARGGDLQGGSTITQQLAKLNYTGSKRTVFRKFREVLYTSRLEQRYSKDELLERYINQVYYGDNAYGIGAAARRFFGTEPARLSPAQAALLAGKIRAPEHLDPRARPRAVQGRRDQVLRNMREHGWLTAGRLASALATPVEVVAPQPVTRDAGKAPHFVELVKREAAALDALGVTIETRRKRLFTGGYTIETTLDARAFDAAAKTAVETFPAPTDPEVAMVSIEPGVGAIRMLYGGRDPSRRFDLASQGRRQPGSSFKPFVYLGALRAGIDPRTRFRSDSPMTVECGGEAWTVRNYEGGSRGTRNVDDATVHSINTVYAQLTAQVGPRSVARLAERAGVSADELRDPACAIGLGGLTRGVSPLEQAAAYATFAAKGVYARPYAIDRIVDRHGEVVYAHSPDTSNAFSAEEAGVLTAALERVVTDGTGRGATIGRPMAGKTGTTENYSDAWFIGYVPQMATAVWVGHADAHVPMTDVHGIAVSGGSFPARVFADYMRVVLDGVPVEALFTASPDDLSLQVRAPSPPAVPAPSATTPPTTSSPPTSTPPVATTAAPTTTTTVPVPSTTVSPAVGPEALPASAG
jgi:penicillin-binding protein 1A